MKHWVRKTFTILTAIVTLGLYVPPTTIDAETPEKDKTFSPKENIEDKKSTSTESEDLFSFPTDEVQLDDQIDEEAILEGLTDHAKGQTIAKLGPRIMEQVDSSLMENLLDQVETEVKNIIRKDDVNEFAITDDPTPGYGEKIFHVYNIRTDEEVARFDVRRENRPGEGYWFNFHYHISDDQFEKHYTVAELYWDKNTPPKWMS